MGILDLFLSGLRRAASDAIRAGISDGIRSVLGDQSLASGQAEEGEAAVRLLLLPAPEAEAPARRRKAE